MLKLKFLFLIVLTEIVKIVMTIKLKIVEMKKENF